MNSMLLHIVFWHDMLVQLIIHYLLLHKRFYLVLATTKVYLVSDIYQERV